jgi:hypothetical protein
VGRHRQPCKIDAGNELVAVPDLVLTDRHLDARTPEQPFDQRLEHALGWRRIRIPEGKQIPQHPCPPPPVAAQGLEALLHPVEEALVPAERRFHRRVDHGGVGDHGAQVDEGPREACHS